MHSTIKSPASCRPTADPDSVLVADEITTLLPQPSESFEEKHAGPALVHLTRYLRSYTRGTTLTGSGASADSVANEVVAKLIQQRKVVKNSARALLEKSGRNLWHSEWRKSHRETEGRHVRALLDHMSASGERDRRHPEDIINGLLALVPWVTPRCPLDTLGRYVDHLLGGVGSATNELQHFARYPSDRAPIRAFKDRRSLLGFDALDTPRRRDLTDLIASFPDVPATSLHFEAVGNGSRSEFWQEVSNFTHQLLRQKDDPESVFAALRARAVKKSGWCAAKWEALEKQYLDSRYLLPGLVAMLAKKA